jgi:hypothetical protein
MPYGSHRRKNFTFGSAKYFTKKCAGAFWDFERVIFGVFEPFLQKREKLVFDRRIFAVKFENTYFSCHFCDHSFRTIFTFHNSLSTKRQKVPASGIIFELEF